MRLAYRSLCIRSWGGVKTVQPKVNGIEQPFSGEAEQVVAQRFQCGRNITPFFFPLAARSIASEALLERRKRVFVALNRLF
jgi:hypothetical protein